MTQANQQIHNIRRQNFLTGDKHRFKHIYHMATTATEKKSALQKQIEALQKQMEALDQEAIHELKLKLSDARKVVSTFRRGTGITDGQACW